MLVRVFRSRIRRIVCLLGLGTPPSQRNWPWRGTDPSGSKRRCEELELLGSRSPSSYIELYRAIWSPYMIYIYIIYILYMYIYIIDIWSPNMESIYGAMWSLIQFDS